METIQFSLKSVPMAECNVGDKVYCQLEDSTNIGLHTVLDKNSVEGLYVECNGNKYWRKVFWLVIVCPLV